MNEPNRVLVSLRFDFAASHRLALPQLSEAENMKMFGKCSNVNGHGHNYQFEVCVRAKPSEGLAYDALERVCDETIMQRYDHRNLNLDTPEFDIAKGGVNPSVENIAKVFFDRLEQRVARACPGSELANVTVWESDRTRATYPA